MHAAIPEAGSTFDSINSASSLLTRLINSCSVSENCTDPALARLRVRVDTIGEAATLLPALTLA